MLQVVRNIFDGQVADGIYLHRISHPNALQTAQNSELLLIICCFVFFCVVGGFTLGCFLGAQRRKQIYHSVRADLDNKKYLPAVIPQEVQVPGPVLAPDLYLSLDGEHYGPYAEEEVRQFLADGLITPDFPAWHEGLADWAELQTLIVLNEDSLLSPVPIEEESFEQAVRDEPPSVLVEPKLVKVLAEMKNRRPSSKKK